MLWVRLTAMRYKAVLKAVALDEHTTAELTRHTRPRGTTNPKIEVEAPYAAWRNVTHQLRAKCFGPRGGRTEVMTYEFDALRAIQKELNFLDAHPALRGLGVIGWHGLDIPCWKIIPDDKGRQYVCYPRPGNEFVYLTPSWEKVRDDRVTIWRPGSGVGDHAREATHLLLWRADVPA